MKRNIAIKITAFLLSAMSAITLISGCGKKNDIADDFRENSTATVSRASRDSCVIQNFDIIYQEPELPTGCEVTALTMAMNYSGCNVDKYTMATFTAQVLNNTLSATLQAFTAMSAAQLLL